MTGMARGAGPVAYHAAYEIVVDSATFSLNYDWSEFDQSGHNIERGAYTDHLLTDYCFARVLSPQRAVIVRLPRSVTNNPASVPEVLLVSPRDLSQFRSYKYPEPGKVFDGIFSLRSFTMTAEPGKRIEGRMTAEERRLIREINEGRYATLYGHSYERSQWEQSPELQQQLAGLRAPALLGRPAPFGKAHAPGFHGFNEFASRFIWGGKKGAMKPVRGFFIYDGSTWKESSADVAVYKRGQSLGPILKFAPFSVLYLGLNFKAEDNSLCYDPSTGRLTLLVPRTLEGLTGWMFDNP